VKRDPEVNVTRNLLTGILDSVALGLEEAGMPLTAEQLGFFAKAGESL
jgi:hypothetical protein